MNEDQDNNMFSLTAFGLDGAIVAEISFYEDEVDEASLLIGALGLDEEPRFAENKADLGIYTFTRKEVSAAQAALVTLIHPDVRNKTERAMQFLSEIEKCLQAPEMYDIEIGVF
jgi:hypothetical protein